MHLRFAFEPLKVRTYGRDAWEYGRLLVGTPDDRVTSLVTPGRAVAFRASGNAELQMRVPFRARPDADVRADQAVRTVLFERALRDVHVWLAIGDDEWTLPAEYLADAAEA